MIARSSLIVGPARIVRGSGVVHTKDSFSIDIVKSQTEIAIDGFGAVDQRDEDVILTCSFVPDGRWTANARALLWPHLNPTIGSDPFTGSDVPTLIHDINSHLHTIKASAVTAMPSLFLGATGTMIGACTITGIRGTSAVWTDEDSIYKVATTDGTFTDTGFNSSDILVQPWTGVWGSILPAIQTEAGWTVDFQTGVAFHKIEDTGTMKASLTSVSVMAKCTPVGISGTTLIDAMLMQSTGGARGKSALAIATDLVISGSVSGSITLKNAKLVSAGYRFGANVIRDGEIGFVAGRSVASGVAGAIAVLA
jgi:hypothetical protein